MSNQQTRYISHIKQKHTYIYIYIYIYLFIYIYHRGILTYKLSLDFKRRLQKDTHRRHPNFFNAR